MDVLMTLGSPGGEASDGAEADAGMPPSLSALYAEMDSDDDRSLSTAEFIAGNRDRMGEDAAGGVFDALDSEGTGALSEDQFIAGAGRGRPDGNPPIGPRPGWPMQADDGQSLA